MKVYLIRHGETTGDIENRYGGTYDDHLTEHGRDQIKNTAQKLVGKNIEIIFSSTLIRAKESAEIINNTLNLSVEFVDSLKERSYGILGGLTKEEANEKFPEIVKLHEDSKNTDPDGESYDDFCNRVINAFNTITQKNYQTIAIVTHGGPIKCVNRYLDKNDLGKIDDGAIIELDVI